MNMFVETNQGSIFRRRGIWALAILIAVSGAGRIAVAQNLQNSLIFAESYPTSHSVPSMPGGPLLPLFWFAIQDPDPTDGWGVWVHEITIEIDQPPGDLGGLGPTLLMQYLGTVAIAQSGAVAPGDARSQVYTSAREIFGVRPLPQDRLINGVDDDLDFVVDDIFEDFPPYEVTFPIRDLVWVDPDRQSSINVPARVYWILLSTDTDIPVGTLASIHVTSPGLRVSLVTDIPTSAAEMVATTTLGLGDDLTNYWSYPLEAVDLELTDLIPIEGEPQDDPLQWLYSNSYYSEYVNRYSPCYYLADVVGRINCGARPYQYPPVYPTFDFFYPDLNGFIANQAGPPTILPMNSNLLPYLRMSLRGGIPARTVGVDDDGDGLTDEEIPDEKDNDQDGRVDEDLTIEPLLINMLRVNLHSLGKYDELLGDGIDQDMDNRYVAQNGKDDDRDGVTDEPDEGVDEEDIYAQQRPLRNDDLDYFVESQTMGIDYFFFPGQDYRDIYLDFALGVDYTSEWYAGGDVENEYGYYDRGTDFVYVDQRDIVAYPYTIPGQLDIYDTLPGDSRIFAGSDTLPVQKLLKNDDNDYFIDDPVNANFVWPPGSDQIYPNGLLAAGSMARVGDTVISYPTAGPVGTTGVFDACVDAIVRDRNNNGLYDPDVDDLLYPGLSGFVSILSASPDAITILDNDDNDFYLMDGGAEANGFPPTASFLPGNFPFNPFVDEIYYDNPEMGVRFELDIYDFLTVSATGYPLLPLRGYLGANGVRDWDVRFFDDDNDYYFKEGDIAGVFEPGIDEVILEVLPPAGEYNIEPLITDLNDNGIFDPSPDVIYHGGATPGTLPQEGDLYPFPQPFLVYPDPAPPYYADFFFHQGATRYYTATLGDQFNFPTGPIEDETEFRTFHLIGYSAEELDRNNRDTLQGQAFTDEEIQGILFVRDQIDPTAEDEYSVLVAAYAYLGEVEGATPIYFIYAFDDPAGEPGVPEVDLTPEGWRNSVDEIIYDNLTLGLTAFVDFPTPQLANSYLVGYATEGFEFNLNPTFAGRVLDDTDIQNILSIWVNLPQSAQTATVGLPDVTERVNTSLINATIQYCVEREGLLPSWLIFAVDDPAGIAEVAEVVRDPAGLRSSVDKIIYDNLLIEGSPLIINIEGDEFEDQNGNGVWDGDIVLYPGENGQIDVENENRIFILVDEEDRDGIDDDRDGFTDEDCNAVPMIALIDEDGDPLDLLDNDGDGLADEDPPRSTNIFALTGPVVDEEKEDDIDNDCDGLTDEDVDYIPMFRLVDEEILDYFIDRPGGREGYFDFIDLNGNGIFEPNIQVREVYPAFGLPAETVVTVGGDRPLDEYYIDWDGNGVYTSSQADGIQGNPDEFINVLYDPTERPLVFTDLFTAYPYGDYALPIDNDGDGEIAVDQIYDVNQDGIVNYRDRYMLTAPNGRDDDGDGEAGSPRDEKGRALADGIDNDGDGFVDEGIDEGFNEDIGDFAFQFYGDLNISPSVKWGDPTNEGLTVFQLGPPQEDEPDFVPIEPASFDPNGDNAISDTSDLFPNVDGYLYTSQPHTHGIIYLGDETLPDNFFARAVVTGDRNLIFTMRTGGWDGDNFQPGPNFGDNWAIGVYPGGVMLGSTVYMSAELPFGQRTGLEGSADPEIPLKFEPPIDLVALPPDIQAQVLLAGGVQQFAYNWYYMPMSDGKPQNGIITKPVYALAFLDGNTGFQSEIRGTFPEYHVYPGFPELFSDAYLEELYQGFMFYYPPQIDPEVGFDFADEGGGFSFLPYADATSSLLPLVALNVADAFGIPHEPSKNISQSETIESLRVNFETVDLEGRGVFDTTDLNAIAEDFTSGLNIFRDDRISFEVNEDGDEDEDGNPLIDEDHYDSIDNDGDGLTDEDGGGALDNDFDGENYTGAFYFNATTNTTTENQVPLAAVEWDPDPDDPIVRRGGHYVVLTPRNSIPIPYDDQTPINRGWDFFVTFRTSETIDYHDAFRAWVRDGDLVFRNGRTGPGTFGNTDPVAANVPTELEDLAPAPLGGDTFSTIQADDDLTVLGFDMHDANQTFHGNPSRLAAVRIWIDDVNEAGGADSTGDFNLTDLAPLLPPNKAWAVIDRDTGVVRPEPYRFGEVLGPDQRIGSINGVALYRDENNSDNAGQFDDPFDPGVENADTPILLSGDEEWNFIIGSTYNVYMVLDPPTYDIDLFPDLPPALDYSPVDPRDPDPLEPLPPDNESPDYVGNDYFVVVRTSKTISYGDDFRVSVGVRAIEGIQGFTSFLFHPPLYNSGRHPFPQTPPYSYRTCFESLRNTRVLRNPVITQTTLLEMVGPENRQDANSPPFPVFGINVFDTEGGTETLSSVRVEVTGLKGFDPLTELKPLGSGTDTGLSLYNDGRAVSQAGRVLIYSDGGGGDIPRDSGDLANAAAQSLGHTTILINNDTAADQGERLIAFIQELTTPPVPDLVIVCQEYTSNAFLALDDLTDYVRGGGHLIFCANNLDAVPVDPLWDLMGIRFAGDLGGAQTNIIWPDIAHPVASVPNIMTTFGPIAAAFADNGDFVTSIGGYATVAVGSLSSATSGLVVAADDGSTVFDGFSPIQYLPVSMVALFQNQVSYLLRAGDDGIFNPGLDQSLELVGGEYLLDSFGDNPGPDGVLGYNEVTQHNDDDPRQRVGLFDEGIDEVFLDRGRGGGTVPGFLDPNDTLVDDGDNNRRDVPYGFPLYPLQNQNDVNPLGDDISAQYSVYLVPRSPQQIPPNDEAASGSRGPDFYVAARTSALIDFRDKYRFRIARNALTFSSGQSMANADVVSHVVDTNVPTALEDTTLAFGATIDYSTQTVSPIAVHMVNSTTDVVRLGSITLAFESVGDYDFSPSDLSMLLTELTADGRFTSGVGLFRDDLTPMKDGIDNDGDGRTDEEMLNYIDDDGDGRVDEPDWADDDPAGIPGVFDFDQVTGKPIDDFVPLARIQLISLSANPFTRFGIEMSVSRTAVDPIGRYMAEVPHGTQFIEGPFADADFFIVVRPSRTTVAGDDFRIRLDPGRITFRDGAYPSGVSIVTDPVTMEMSIPPTFAFINPPDTASLTIFSGTSTIAWTDDDPDNNAQISLYYVFEDELAAGGPIEVPSDPRLTLIRDATGIPEDPDGFGFDTFDWNVAGDRIRAGDPLRVVAVVEDGFNVPLIVTSSLVEVDNAEPFIDVTAPNPPDEQVFSGIDTTWIDGDLDNDAAIALYLVRDATRPFIEALMDSTGIQFLPTEDVGTDIVFLATGISEGFAPNSFRIDMESLIDSERVTLGERYFVLAVISDFVPRVVSPPPAKRILIPAYYDFSDGAIVPVLLPSVRVVEPREDVSVNGEFFVSFTGTLPNGATSAARVELYLSLESFGFTNADTIEGGRDVLPADPPMIFLKVIPIEDLVFDPARPAVFSGSASIQIVELNPEAGIVGFLPWVPLNQDTYVFAQVVENPVGGDEVKSGNFSAGRLRFNEHFIRVLQPSALTPSATGIATFRVEYAAISRIPAGASPTVSLFRDLDDRGLNGVPFTNPGGMLSLNLPMPPSGQIAQATFEWDLTKEPLSTLFVYAILNDSADDFGEEFYDYSDGPVRIGKEVEVRSGTAAYIVSGMGGIFFSDGSAPKMLPPEYGFDIVRNVEPAFARRGYYLLTGDGAIHSVGDAPALVSPVFDSDMAVDLELLPTIEPSGYVLDRFGGVHPVGGAPFLGDLDFGLDMARDLEITPSGKGYVILDVFGGLHCFGDAELPGAPWLPSDSYVDIELTASGKGYYVLASSGAVIAAGDARSYGYEILEKGEARDLTITGGGAGYLVMDAYGEIHGYGEAEGTYVAPRFTSAIAQDMEKVLAILFVSVEALDTNLARTADPAVGVRSDGLGPWVLYSQRGSMGQDLMIYDAAIGLATPFDTSAGDQTQPALSGDVAVWTSSVAGNRDIFLTDLADPEGPMWNLTATTANGLEPQEQPDIHRHWVVYAGYDPMGDDFDIYLQDVQPLLDGLGVESLPAPVLLTDGQVDPANADQSAPKVFSVEEGGFETVYVVWEHLGANGLDVYLYQDVAGDGVRGQVEILAGGPGNQMEPDIHAREIGYTSGVEHGTFEPWAIYTENDGGDVNLFAVRLVEGRPVLALPSDPDNPSEPIDPNQQRGGSVSGQRITWVDQRSGFDALYMFDFLVRTPEGDTANPVGEIRFTAGNLVIPAQETGGPWVVYLQQSETGFTLNLAEISIDIIGPAAP